MKKTQRILVIEDDEYVLKSLMRLLRMNEYDAQGFTNTEEALSLCATRQFDLIISDQRMPSLTGIEFFRKARVMQPLSRLILISGYTDFGEVVEAFNEGVIHKFIIKPWDNEIVIGIIKDQLSIAEAGKAIPVSKEEPDSRPLVSKKAAANGRLKEFNGTFTNDEVLLKQIDFLQLSKDSNAPILITGEMGSGKRLMAEAAHYASDRSKYPFRIFNNSSSSVKELESSLFGIEEKNFRNNIDANDGLLSSAQYGTIVLHEVTLLPLEIQGKLAEALENKKYTPVGSNKSIPFDIRIITTTTEDLNLATEENRLLDRLRLQLDVLSLRLPPLRERKNDILPLFDMFLHYELQNEPDTPLEIDPFVYDLISQYCWPGNIVELMNVCTYVASLAKTNDNCIGVKTLPLAIRQAALEMTAVSSSTNALNKLDDTQLQRIIEEFYGKIDPAAKFLGVNRLTLWQRVQKLDITSSSLS